MGYTKIVQWADYTEVYNYQKNVYPKQKHTRRRSSKPWDNKQNYRSEFSAKRAKKSFLRIIEANVHTKGAFEFVTLTNYKMVSIEIGYAYLRTFVKNLREYQRDLTIISVPEWQTSGKLHFHCAIWGLPKELTKSERKTRFLQRQWARGYVDVSTSKQQPLVLCRYMAKYMSKSYTDLRLRGRRAYSSSYNVDRPLQAGSNTLSAYLINITPVDVEIVKSYDYNTQFLGNCNYTLFKKL